MSRDRHTTAIATHALGWTALLATAVLARTGALGSGWRSWLVLGAGWLLFVVLIAWSGSHILTRVRAGEATAQ